MGTLDSGHIDIRCVAGNCLSKSKTNDVNSKSLAAFFCSTPALTVSTRRWRANLLQEEIMAEILHSILVWTLEKVCQIGLKILGLQIGRTILVWNWDCFQHANLVSTLMLGAWFTSAFVVQVHVCPCVGIFMFLKPDGHSFSCYSPRSVRLRSTR